MRAARPCRGRAVFLFRQILMAIILMLCGATYSQATFSLDIDIGRRYIGPSEKAAFAIVLGGVNADANSRTELAKSVTVRFPGLREMEIGGLGSDGRMQVTGRLGRPGFYAFEVTATLGGETQRQRDYLVVEGGEQHPAFDHIGYYVFLGRGDFWDETHPLALWRLYEWKRFADWMSNHGADTLFVLLNGYTLAYPSEKYPELRDRYSANAKTNFLHEFIDYAHKKKIKVYLTLTTDDHAEGFGRMYPETTRINKYGYAPSRRSLVLENAKVQQYLRDTFDEILNSYSNADGVVLHPSETDPDRFNAETRSLYKKETGSDLAKADTPERYRWYNQKYAEFVRELYKRITARNPTMELIMFSCWWQDQHQDIYREILPQQVRICVWYYDEQEVKAFHEWAIWPWVRAFGAGRILYMPSLAHVYPVEPGEQMLRNIRVDRLVSTAETLGVKSCIFFAGWSLGDEEERMRDLAIIFTPTSYYANDRATKEQILPDMYTDYFGVRDRLLK
jgi:hypothetical protein